MARKRRHTAEDTTKISFIDREWQERFHDPRPGDGEIRWTDGVSVSFELDEPEEAGGQTTRAIRFQWEEDGPTQTIIAHFRSIGRQPKGKPIRYWLVECPGKCSEHRRTLYKIPGKWELACRICADLKHRKGQQQLGLAHFANRDPVAFLKSRDGLSGPRSVMATYKVVLKAMELQEIAQQRKRTTRMKASKSFALRRDKMLAARAARAAESDDEPDTTL